MWRLKRRAPAGSTAVVDEPSYDEWPGTHAELWEEIGRRTEAGRTAEDRSNERELMRLRHLAGIRLLDDAPADPQFVAADSDALPTGDPPPDVPGRDLTAGLIRAGILRDGCLLVRGLVARERALHLAGEIETAFAQRVAGVQGQAELEGYVEPFDPHPRFGPVEGRHWIEMGGGLLAADSPRLHRELLEMFDDAGVPEIVSEYLGEPALMSVHKTTLRQAEPSVAGAWHQDGAFMGDVRSLNLWLSLSRCGDEAPGLDIVPRRIEDFLASADDTDTWFDYQISPTTVERVAGQDVVRPVFEPGDALFFDERFVHQTGSDPSMPNVRYAVESWFFGGSSFPQDYAPMAVSARPPADLRH